MPRRLVMQALVLGVFLGTTCATTGEVLTAPGSRICRQIEAQLASVSSLAPGQAGRTGKAIERLRARIAQARAKMRSAGCGIFNQSTTCLAMSASIERTQREIASLQRNGGAAVGRRARTQLVAALKANDCRGNIVVARRETSLLTRFFGAPTERQDPLAFLTRRDLGRIDSPSAPPQRRKSNVFKGIPGFASETYRTYCVRSCDGYFFPVSASSSPSDFARDARNCQSACPGADVSIFSTEGDADAAETMVSVATGQAYARSPKAFLYRSDAPRDSACSCQMKKPPVILAVEGMATNPANDTRAYPADGSESSLSGKGEQTATLKQSSPPIRAPVPRRVRVVGPTFLPDPEGAEALPIPGRTAVQ